MTDFEKLSAALRETPAPDPKTKAKALALAKENFAQAQESETARRPIRNQPKRVGIWTRMETMLTNSLRPALYVTSSLVAVGIGVILWQSQMPRAFVDLPEASETVVSAESAAASSDIAQSTHVRRVLEPAPLASQEELMAAPTPVGTSRLAAEGDAFAAADMSISAMPVLREEPFIAPEISGRDQFANEASNGVKITSEEPVSTFSVDVDTASYAIARRWLESGQLPPKEAVRVEEFINAFDYDYARPTGDVPFAVHTRLMETPWNGDTQLLQVAIQGRDVEDRQALDLVFLVDTSGSMQAPDKLPLLQQSLKMLLGALQPDDTVALVTYAGHAGVVLEPTPVSERSEIERALKTLTAGGGTAGAAGLSTAYDLAEQSADDDRLSRVILATDGDFNIGLSSPEAMEEFIAEKRESGTSLSVLGFGRGNLNDALMQSLAQSGNGQASYIDTALEAQRVLVEDVQSLVPIAQDVKIQIEFNPAQVAEYRLIGYETRALDRADFNNDRVDAGDIGAGHSVTALYELVPVGSPAQLSDPLRYRADVVAESDEVGFLKLRYKDVGDTQSKLIEEVLPTDVGGGADFSVALAGFGQLLRDNSALGDWSWQELVDFAATTIGADPSGDRQEALRLMRLAATLSE